MQNNQSAEPGKPQDEFQKLLLQMSPEEIRYRLYYLPYETLQQVMLNITPPAPAQKITVTVKTRRGIPVDLDIKQEGWKVLKQTEQVVWVCDGGKLEIRFDRALSPFIGDRFEVPQNAKAFSGKPDPQRLKNSVFRYTVLVTTPDGFFLKRDAEVSIERKSAAAK